MIYQWKAGAVVKASAEGRGGSVRGTEQGREADACCPG